MTELHILYTYFLKVILSYDSSICLTNNIDCVVYLVKYEKGEN